MLELWASLGADRCVVCDAGRAVDGAGALDGLLCGRCLQAVPERLTPLPVAPVDIDRAWSLGPYAGPLGALVRVGKFGGNEAVLQALGELAAGSFPAIAPDAVVAVPSSPWRLLARGMNPAERFAAPLARAIGVPLTRPLVRRSAKAQSSLRHADRSANVRGAYHPVASVPPRVLLVDDVVTTGSTAAACARALRAAGAHEVWLVSVAAAANGVARQA